MKRLRLLPIDKDKNYALLLTQIVIQISAYPVMLVHNLFVKRQSANVQHCYFVVTGLGLAYWALGGKTSGYENSH